MKSIKKVFGIVLVTMFMVSCSTVRVTDSWKDESSSDISGEKMLVVNITENDASRKRFEKDMVASLNKNGFESLESYKNYPELNPAEKLTHEESTKLKKKLQDNGVNLVVITSVREIEQYVESNSTSSGFNSMPYHGYGHYRGFHGYYGGAYMTTGTTNTKSEVKKKYKVETLVYDLSKPKDKELLAVISSEIDDPKKVTVTSEDFSKKVIKELKELYL